MGIYKKGNIFFIDYYVHGKRKREKIGPSRKLAETVLCKRKAEIAEGKFLEIKREIKVLFDDFACEYLEFSKTNKRKKSYLRDVSSLNHLSTFFAGRYLSEIDALMVEKYKAERKNGIPVGKRDEVSAATVNRELACLRNLFNKAVEWGKTSTNPLHRVKLFKENNKRLRYLNIEEIQQLLKECNSYLGPIVFTALNTGMRKGEILNLKWQDIDFKQKLIHIEESKSGERRDIPMNRQLAEVLRAIPRRLHSFYVFCNKNGEPFGDVRKSFLSALKRAGIQEFRFHDLRHTFASQLVMNGVDLTTVKELLGHKSIEMTLRYAHLSPDHKMKAVEHWGTRMDTFWTPWQNQKEEKKKRMA